MAGLHWNFKNDESTPFLDGLYVGRPEGALRLFAIPLHDKSHDVKRDRASKKRAWKKSKLELEEDMLNVILLEEHLSVKVMTLLEKGKDVVKDSDSDEGEDGSDKDNSSDEDSDGNNRDDDDDEENQAVNITIK